MNKVEKIKAEIEKRKDDYMSQAQSFHDLGMEERMSFYSKLASIMAALIRFIDSLEEEPVSKDLEEAAHSYVDTTIEWFDSEGNPCCYPAFEAGAQWQKERDQSTIELAEDHAYLAGQEKVIDKACEWIKANFNMPNDFELHFKKAMED